MPKGVKLGGRVAGTPNKATKEFRETITQLLSDNAPNVAIWLARVAEGVPETEDSKALAADPGRALDLMAKLAEYAAPKLNRTEHVGDGGGPVRIIAGPMDETL